VIGGGGFFVNRSGVLCVWGVFHSGQMMSLQAAIEALQSYEPNIDQDCAININFLTALIARAIVVVLKIAFSEVTVGKFKCKKD